MSIKKSILYHAFALVPKAHRSKGGVIICFITFNALLDLFSLATFIPLIAILIDPDQLINNTFLSKAYNLSGFNRPVDFAVLLTVLVIAFIAFKTFTTNGIAYRKAAYAYSVANDLASRALTQYLLTPYPRFTTIDYTREMNRISNLPLTFANNFIIPAGTIFAESLVALLLLAGIAAYDIKVFLFLLIILAPLSLLYRLKNKRIKKISEEIKSHYPRLLKYTMQAIEGLPEIRAFNKEHFFKTRFNKTFEAMGRIFSTDHTVNTSTSRTTELVTAICIGTLILYALLSGRSSSESVLLLGIYAGVSFRIIPSINRVFASAMQIKTHEYVAEELQQMVAPDDLTEVAQIPACDFKEKIELQNIGFGYEGHAAILKNASLAIHKGEKIVLTGTSGSGKTTLFLIMMRFLREQKGAIEVDGKKVTTENEASFQRLMGYVPQNPYVLDTSILENIAFGMPPEKIDHQKVNQLVRDLDLEAWITSLPDGLNTNIGEKGTKLSGGQRQRIAIARTLYHNAQILLLDEVTNHLDHKTEQEVLQTLDNLALQNKTIILVSHRYGLWKSFDTMYELTGGRFQKVVTTTFHSSY